MPYCEYKQPLGIEAINHAIAMILDLANILTIGLRHDPTLSWSFR